MSPEGIHLVRPDESSTPPDTIMIIRHGEKPTPHAGSARGVLPDGKHDPHSLTVYGWVRAGALIELFAPSWGEPPAGLRRPDTIYAAGFDGGHSKRALETVFPLAARLGLMVNHRFGHGDEKRMARQLKSRPGASVVSWHHDGIPKIVKHLGTVRPTPPAQWPEDRYDMVWVFVRDADGWTFHQVPQLLVPGDLPYPIIDPDSEESDLGDGDGDEVVRGARRG